MVPDIRYKTGLRPTLSKNLIKSIPHTVKIPGSSWIRVPKFGGKQAKKGWGGKGTKHRPFQRHAPPDHILRQVNAARQGRKSPCSKGNR